MSNDNNIIEFTGNDDNTRHTTDSVLDHLIEYRDDIVSLTCVVEHGDGWVGVYAEDKDIYTLLFQKNFLDHFVRKAFSDRVEHYTEE